MRFVHHPRVTAPAARVSWIVVQRDFHLFFHRMDRKHQFCGWFTRRCSYMWVWRCCRSEASGSQAPQPGHSHLTAFKVSMVRVGGIEPPRSGWKPDILPLNYTRRVESANSHVEGTAAENEHLRQTIQLWPVHSSLANGQEIR